jgi:F0F1-type ATP synthase membrane subunit b/b'
MFTCASLGLATAQDASQAAPPGQTSAAERNSQHQAAQGTQETHEGSADLDVGNANAAAAEILEHASEQAAHKAESWGRPFGLSHDTSFAVSLALNFVGIAAVFYVLLRAKIPQMFRDRTNAIQKALKEAHDASADASRRLADIETRLSKLDAEVADIRASAEREATAEEERIRASAEEDKHKVVEAAESEIAAIARSARHDLKSFAASLAVDIAAHKIKVDDNTDQALVRQFVGHLGKDGQ